MPVKHHCPEPDVWKARRPVVKALRVHQTQAEAELWEQLRNRKLGGFKFRRQHAMEGYVVDFYCHQAGLIVELDGPVHQSQAAADQDRQQSLETMGCRVLRFSNDQVMHHMSEVLEQILAHLNHPR